MPQAAHVQIAIPHAADIASVRSIIMTEAAHENAHKDTDNFLVTVGR
jgi:hypothetical protein